MTIPNLLLCVGAQKSGTTWLYNRLAEHEETRSATHKELHYFTTIHNDGLMGPTIKANLMKAMMDKHPRRVAKFIQAQATGGPAPRDVQRIFRPMNDRWYTGIFRGQGRYSMDFSPEYALLPDAGHEHVKKVSENQKIIFIMREPVDRALSAVRYMFKQKGKDISKASASEILEMARRPAITELSGYVETVERLQKHYRAEDLKIMFYETMMTNKSDAVKDVCAWLGIAGLELPEAELNKRDNPTKAFDIPDAVVHELVQKLGGIRTEIEQKFPEALVAWSQYPR